MTIATRALAVFLALTASLPCPAQSNPAAAEQIWVATWGCSAQLTETKNLPPEPGLSSNTLRQVLRASLGGKRLRAHFSNAFGNSPVTLESAHVAKSLGNDAIDPATEKAMTFRGASGVTIAPGAEVVSDAFEFTFPPQAALAVTLHFGATSAAVTGHPGSRTTSYLAAGDAVAASRLAGSVTTQHWYILTGLDTLADPPGGALIALGDSITDGRGSTTDANNRWPDDLANRLMTNDATKRVAVVNQGVGGNAVLAGGLGPTARARFDRDVLEQAGARWVIVLEGVNDIGADRNQSVATNLIAAYGTFVKKAHEHKLRVYGATITPFGGSFYSGPTHEEARQSVNAWIRNGPFDAVIDFDAAVRDPAAPARLRTDYDSGDHLHLNAGGLPGDGRCSGLDVVPPVSGAGLSPIYGGRCIATDESPTPQVCRAVFASAFGLLLLTAISAAAQFSYTTNLGEITITGYSGPPGEAVIPETINGLPVSSIGNTAFISSSSLTGVSIPASVRNIGDYAFESCSQLSRISIPGTVTNIGLSAFYACGSLTNVSMADGVIALGGNAFFNCPQLVRVALPATLSQLPYFLFSQCAALSQVTIPDGVTNIGDSAFFGCASLAEINLPAGVKKIGGAAFAGSGLTHLTIPGGVNQFGDAFSDCDSLTNVVLLDGIASVPTNAFLSCRSLAQVALPPTVTNIDTTAFNNCLSLSHIEIPDGLRVIGAAAFRGSGLTHVSIPASVTAMGDRAFYQCTNLLEVDGGGGKSGLQQHEWHAPGQEPNHAAPISQRPRWKLRAAGERHEPGIECRELLAERDDARPARWPHKLGKSSVQRVHQSGEPVFQEQRSGARRPGNARNGDGDGVLSARHDRMAYALWRTPGGLVESDNTDGRPHLWNCGRTICVCDDRPEQRLDRRGGQRQPGPTCLDTGEDRHIHRRPGQLRGSGSHEHFEPLLSFAFALSRFHGRCRI